MNLANKITLSRIFLVPIIMFFLLVQDYIPFPELDIYHLIIPINQVIAVLIFILAASTDSLDGYIARKRKLVTNLGKLLDPLADKLLITAVLVSLVELDKLPAWIAIVIISREFAVTGLRQIALLDGSVIAASNWGKIKTGVQITAIISLLINNFPFNYVNFPFDQIITWVAAVVTLYSGIDYFIKNKHIIEFMSSSK
jgi:CDP-diacylglycerol--glycerol-3-phosphate 3-phosphatidyltransferase